MKKYLIISFCILISLCTEAQRLIYSQHAIKEGDIIIKQQLEYIDPGVTGHNICWNFSNVVSTNDNYQIDIFNSQPEDSSYVNCTEHNTTYRYKFRSDTLYLMGYYNRTTMMDYGRPEAILKFPFYYGDTLKNSFVGKGLYCSKIPLKTNGITVTTGDATGYIITPDKDTIKNVLRTHRVKDFIKTEIDSVRVRLDMYQWFSPNYRYPLFETVKSTTQKGDSVLEKFSTAFYMSSINERLVKSYIENSTDLNSENKDILISCNTYPNPVKNDLKIIYELSVDAKVSFLLCDISGRPWIIVSERNLSAGTQSQTMNMGNLNIGNYVLYIIVKDKVFRKIIIKL